MDIVARLQIASEDRTVRETWVGDNSVAELLHEASNTILRLRGQCEVVSAAVRRYENERAEMKESARIVFPPKGGE